jgi:DNA-binding MarR family transcriptional regulator
MSRRSLPQLDLCRPEETFGFRLWHVLHAWQRRVEAALSPLDLTHMQFVVLAITASLLREGENVSQSRIAGFGKIDRMMLSKMLRLLEDKGYVERGPHPQDTRANSVELTRAGREALAAAVPLVRGAQDAFFGRLPAADQDALASQLDRLMALEGCAPANATER